MDIEKVLQQIGLTTKESKVYLALLELGPSLISQIARESGLHRPTVYQVVSALQAKGLVTVAPRGKQKRYTAESPEKLKILFETFRAEIEKSLPELQTLYEKRQKRPLVKFLEGKQGIAAVLEDLVTTLKRGEVYYRYSSRRAGVEAERYFPAGLRERRDSKNIQRYLITDALTPHQAKTPTMDRAYKIIPPESGLFDDNIVQLIYADKVVIADLGSLSAVLIENQNIAELQKKIFKILYNRL